jgi:glycosyltransferase involved in cell wall biosynthesis
MKVAFANNYLYLRGGSERVLFDEMALLRDRGVTAAVFSRDHPENVASEFARCFPRDLDVSGGIGQKLRSLPKLIYAVDARRGMARFLGEFRPDVIHAHNIYGRLSTSILDAAAASRTPVVLTLHDYKLICPSYKLKNRGRVCEACRGFRFHRAVSARCHKGSALASAIYAAEAGFNHLRGSYTRRVARLIAPSRFLREKFVEFGWAARQIDVVPNFLDVEQFEPQFTPGEYFLYLGRLSAEKGVPTLIEAFHRLPAPARLVIAGGGPLEASLRARWEGRRGVEFAGHISGERLAATVRGALAVIVPSEWYENAPMAVLEAMAWGKPVIGAAIGGIPEMVDDGVTGFLFEAGNADDLERKLARMRALSPREVAEMGQAGRGAVAAERSAARHYEQLMSVYARARSTPGP